MTFRMLLHSSRDSTHFPCDAQSSEHIDWDRICMEERRYQSMIKEVCMGILVLHEKWLYVYYATSQVQPKDGSRVQ